MITRLSRFVCGLAFCVFSAAAADITEPVSVAQYDDSVVVYLHGFDLYQDLSLECRLLGSDGTVADVRTMDLGERWEKPSITMRTGASEYSGVVVSASSGGTVFFRRFYPLTTHDPQTAITTAGIAAIEAGQFLSKTPTIPLPDLDALPTVTLSSAAQTLSLDSVTLDVKSDVNFPLVSANNNAALSRQTDFPDDDTKLSFYVPLKAQLYDANSDPGELRHFLCEIPIDPAWLTGSDDIEINLAPSDIKVHASTALDDGRNILGTGRGGLGQLTGSMTRDADGNIYFTSVPSQIVRFSIAKADWEVPPVDVFDHARLFRPTRDEVLGDGSTNLFGNFDSYMMITAMNHISPPRIIYTGARNRWFSHATFFTGAFSLPQDHWDCRRVRPKGGRLADRRPPFLARAPRDRRPALSHVRLRHLRQPHVLPGVPELRRRSLAPRPRRRRQRPSLWRACGLRRHRRRQEQAHRRHSLQWRWNFSLHRLRPSQRDPRQAQSRLHRQQ